MKTNKSWIKIRKFNYKKINSLIKDLKKKNIHISPWIENVFKNYKSKLNDNDFPMSLHIIKVKDLKINKPCALNKIYKSIKKKGFDLVPPEISLITRLYYNKQKKGDWLRFATPLKSLIDSDGVPHLPKLGKALNKKFIETYWSYPKAIFHPHNKFVVRKR